MRNAFTWFLTVGIGAAFGLSIGAWVAPAAERMVLVAGGGPGVSNVPATHATLRNPFGVAFDAAGNMFIVEMAEGERVLKVDGAGVLTVVAGRREKGFAGDGGPAAQALFNGMHNLAITAAGDLLLADSFNYRVRRIDGRTGQISTIAGMGRKAFSGDGGLAAAADFSSTIQIALDPAGQNLFVADIENRRVRKIELASGVVTTVAGNGEKGVPRDGAEATSAPLVDPRAVAPLGDGSFYVLERGGHALRLVDAAGRIRTVAGTGQAGLSGDGGPALEATFRGPKHLCVDRDGSVLIADESNHVIRRYLPKEGRVVRVAGTGKQGSAGLGGPPLQAELSGPHGVTVHRDGTIYIADSYNHRVLKIAR